MSSGYSKLLLKTTVYPVEISAEPSVGQGQGAPKAGAFAALLKSAGRRLLFGREPSSVVRKTSSAYQNAPLTLRPQADTVVERGAASCQLLKTPT
jgi:hypothetical protein